MVWREAIPFICPAEDQEGTNPPEGATWVVATGVGAGAGAGLIDRDAFLARPSALSLCWSRTVWLTLWPSRRWSYSLSIRGRVLFPHSSQWYPDPVLELMCLAREESLPKAVSHAHRKAEWRASFAWSSSLALVWNETLQTRQVFAVGPSSLVCSKKLAGDNRAGFRFRAFSVGVFLGRVVVSKGLGLGVQPIQECGGAGSERTQGMGSKFWVD